MSLGIFRILGLVVFMYLLWRDLRDNYGDEKIINYAWIALLGFLVGETNLRVGKLGNLE